MACERDKVALEAIRERQDAQNRALLDQVLSLKGKVMLLEEDAILMRQLKKEVKGVDLRITVMGGAIGAGHQQNLNRIMARIQLEANQGY